MASIKVITAGYEAEIDIPDEDEVTVALAHDVIYQTVLDEYQEVAILEHQEDKLAVLSDLLVAIKAARAAALPALKLTTE